MLFAILYVLMWPIGVMVVILFSVKTYIKLTCEMCKSSARMDGKTVIVTGGSSGIGFETAKHLADRGARVIIACQSIQEGIDAEDLILKSNPNAAIEYEILELSSLSSVKEFCKKILRRVSQLHVLINNAGAMGLGNHKTEDGLHIGMQVNYFGPFLLTCLLLPLLKSSAPSRIINVSSMAHKYGIIDFENLNMEKYWNDYLVYANSKLCLNLMTIELSQRLKGTGVTVNSLHPGMAGTNIYKNLRQKIVPIAIVRSILEAVLRPVVQTSWEASQTSVFLAVSEEVQEVSGRYFSNCKETEPSPICQDLELTSKLWNVSEKLVQYSSPQI